MKSDIKSYPYHFSFSLVLIVMKTRVCLSSGGEQSASKAGTGAVRSSSGAAGLTDPHEKQIISRVRNSWVQLCYSLISKCLFRQAQEVPAYVFCFRSASTAAPGNSQDSVTLVLDCIKSAVRFQKTISEAWLKVSK